jgi:uncharacterized membrane protein YphA (DoxX/SURF4 family)
VLFNFDSFFARFPWLTYASQIGVGCLFIFSGFIKSNDPHGFAYKLDEYFDVFAEDASHFPMLATFFHFLKNLSLGLAIFVCMTEVALGFMLLIGAKVRLTLWLLLLQIVFFTFLTFYSACYNKVTHCGCFGDFIQLTPWQSFGKDLVLMLLIAVLWAGKSNIKTLFNPLVENLATALIIIGSIAFPLYAWYYLPPLDFRPYAPGKNICEEMKPGPHFKPAVYRSHFIYKNLKTGKKENFTDRDYPWKDTLNWALDQALPATLEEPAVDEQKIFDFKLNDFETDDDLTDSIMKNPGYHFLLICYDLGLTDKKVQGKVNDFAALCEKDHIQFVGVTGTQKELVRDFRHEVQAMYPFLSCDQTVLKTMIRSNPGLMLMKGCQVVANWPAHSFPSYNDVKTAYFKKSNK